MIRIQKCTIKVSANFYNLFYNQRRYFNKKIMEPTNPPADVTVTTQNETQNVRPEYSGDKGDFLVYFIRNTPVEHKNVPAFSFG